MWEAFVAFSESLFDLVVEILKILGLAALLVLVVVAGALLFVLLFALGAGMGYVITLDGAPSGFMLAFSCVALASFIATTDKTAREMSPATERVLDGVAFGSILLGFLWSSVTAVPSTQTRWQLLVVVISALVAGLCFRPDYVRWRARRRAARP